MKLEAGIKRHPVKTKSRSNYYNLSEMTVGDSFLIPIENKKNVCQAIRTYKWRHLGWDYLVDLDESSELRCWRTA